MVYIQNFGQRVTLWSKLCNKHIRIILTSVLSGGQAACRLERTDPVCWWKKLIWEFISYFSIHSERQVHSWNFDIGTQISWAKLLCVLERKELLDSSSPSVHFFFGSACSLDLEWVGLCAVWSVVLTLLWRGLQSQWKRAISVSFPNAALSCQHSPYLGTGTNQCTAYHVSEQVHKLCLRDLALWFSYLLFPVNIPLYM